MNDLRRLHARLADAIRKSDYAEVLRLSDRINTLAREELALQSFVTTVRQAGIAV